MSDLSDLLGNVGKRRQGKQQDATDDGLDFLTGFKKKVKSSGPVSIPKRTSDAGITTLDIADLPEPYKAVMFAVLRNKKAANDGLSIGEVQNLVSDVDELQTVLDELVENNYLQKSGNLYQVKMRAKKGRLSNLLSALDE